LKGKGPRARFSYADVDTTLHRELPLIDNLLMAAGESMALESYETKLEFLNARLEAENLRSLASWFKDPSRKAQELSVQERVMAAVCHALLMRAEDSFINLASTQLDPMCLMHLQKIIKEKSLERHITVGLADKSQWKDGFDFELMLEAGLLVSKAA
jgi:ABC-type branched-subunit amino acid transport system ATPase component